ncbi:hypothetical protein [Amycolatopsis sp. H20-H5]|uniref:hypothetical protein n=1 Tax=Amycolatopsis sp. H20-H5 TaxID=3046309 RepID=UPI002DB62C15|nr:hypothetical protein [Amycolatopsis sp. H20-H5]MEC3978187.1 hypothetical protein [Amycolatopsis sp. H20-H5]
MAYTAQEIVALVNQGKGPTDMYAGGDHSSELSKLHDKIAEEMLQLQGAMQDHWQGDGAGQAYAGAGPLVQASQVSGQHLTQAEQLYQGQGSSFKDLQGKVAEANHPEPLGDKPKDDWVSGTWVSFMSNRSNEIDAWNQKAQQVVDGYSTYHGQSTDNSGRWAAPSQYGELGLPPGGADITPTSPDTGPGSQSHVTGSGSGRHSASNSFGGPAGHPGGVSGPNDPGHSGGSVDGGVPQQGGHSSTLPPGSQSHGGPSQADGTKTAGYFPPTTTGVGIGGSDYGTTGGYGATGFGPGGSGPGGFGPGSGSASGFLPGGGFGPGGSGTASGVGSGAGGLAGGKGSGAGALGGEPGAGGRLGSGAAGGSGRPGGSGMGAGGGMGRGGKGEGAEDSEHKTADYLLEHDPDDALVGELPRATPPVIGL